MSAVQLGQYAPADKVLVHLSDTHFLAKSAALYGAIDTDLTINRAFEQLHRAGICPDALILTGDVADRGEADAYRRIRRIVDAAAARWHAQVVWVMGNHDKREPFRAVLLDDRPLDAGRSRAPVDQVHDVDGLRIIALDTSVPGYHHGDLTDGQLQWLADVLSSPARHGSILALHHPPLPTPLPLMSVLELHHQPSLAAVIAGSDVRAILGGHLHYSSQGLFAGIPVSVAAATCYTMDLSAPEQQLTGVNGGQTLNLVHIYSDQITHSQVPIGEFATVTQFPAHVVDRLAALSPDERQQAFSRQIDTSDRDV